jgi:hypothetical protein
MAHQFCWQLLVPGGRPALFAQVAEGAHAAGR